MARYFNSLDEANAGLQGYKGRNAYAAAQREARRAALNSPEALARAAHLRAASEDQRLMRVIVTAGDHVIALRGKLAAARRQSEYMNECSYLTGDIHADAATVRRQIEGLPSLIARAEQELVEARAALAAHRAKVAEANSVQPVEPPQVVADVEADPADETPRGRGRPRKVAA